ncbi:DEAD/DEAH box helicase family protein [Maridesulfovibrio sp.]|uniref:DEAD/DEAH box helicase family protein n=1 Tax=Maridesulfovibrio sp. TaxID=2795000 RepID=UPI002A1869EB|nr:DEAD/DEAH box helicase family protein [Maridesulfovibrio sp.]
MKSNFTFLKSQWPELYSAAREAESQVKSAPRSCLFSCRYTLEQATHWLYDHDEYLKKPYAENLGALIHEPSFKENMPPSLFPKVKIIHKAGNLAAHSGRQPKAIDALQCVKELFHFLYWLYRSYSDVEPQDQEFKAALLVEETQEQDLTLKQIQELKAKLEDQAKALNDERKAHALTREELTARNEKVTETKERNASIPDPHDYSEAETREYIIDLLLREAGWDLEKPNVREFPVVGMPTKSGKKDGKGKADYVLWGDDGKPLAVVEAKRTTANASKGKRQAELYADCLEQMYDQRPILFYTNGYETFIWDDTFYPPRPVQGFHKKDELQRLVMRRTQSKDLSEVGLNPDIAGRPYQQEGLRRVTGTFEERQRKALVVMATGTGKTRFSISLADVLQRAGWAKRILFLADRNALVRQAKNAFLALMPDSNPLDIRTDRESGDTERVVLSTYHTMMGVIDEFENGVRRFGVGHFDLIIIDEAHRSVYQKFGAIFDYFDSLLLGLTATPRDEVDRNTYELFELEDEVPTYNYELAVAVEQGHLVPPTNISVPLKFPREGVKYDELPADEKDQFEDTFWKDGDDSLREIDKSQLNKWLFNQDTVDKVLKFLFENGIKIDGGEKLGKTIIFAANIPHARYIQERFDSNFPKEAGKYARIIASGEDYGPFAESLLEEFSQSDKLPQIAISVDMLDTGVDVPEVVNLVFFKRVYSRVKFHQMIGRGTRLCENLFAPGEHKEQFVIFDFCENFEFFSNNPAGYENGGGQPLHQKIFLKRLGLLRLLAEGEQITDDDDKFLESVKDKLYRTINGLNVDSFMVRPAREYVERYADLERWDSVSDEDEADLSNHLAKLKSDFDEGNGLCKRFDMIILNAQTCLLTKDSAFEGYKGKISALAQALTDKATIPAVQKEMVLIEAILTDEFWAEPSCGLLERIRIALRELIRFLDTETQEPVYTNFTDTLGEATEVDLPGDGLSLAKYRLKVEQFIRSHMDHIAINKLYMNKPINTVDISELERMLFSAEEIGDKNRFSTAFGEDYTLGTLIRNIVGLDRSAAENAFQEFIQSGNYNADQIHFVNHIIEHLTSQGTMDPGLLFESSPYIDRHPHGVGGVFSMHDARKVLDLVEVINDNAVA